MAKKSEREARQEKSETILFVALCTVIVFMISLASAVLYQCKPNNIPSISVESLLVTVVGIASDSQVKADLEVVFGPVENTNRDTIVYSQLNAMAFHLEKLGLQSGHPSYSNKKLVENVTVAESLEQVGGDKTTVTVRMRDVTLDVDGYEQRIYDRYGASYLRFELAGFVEMKDGTCFNDRFRSRSRMTAESKVLKAVFPLFQWNQTNKIEFQPPKRCFVRGN